MIYDELRSRYLDSGELSSLLDGSGITILNQFLDNWEIIERFNHTFYSEGLPKTVLCGVNPGRLGAGKTGIPFLDFSSLSKIMDDVDRQDTERSAQFFFDVVQEIGAEKFYKTFYVTNISWVGYVKDSKNINYYKLPPPVKKFVHDMFKFEMESVSPTTIISLSRDVENSVKELFSDVDHKYLPHPNNCAFPKKYDRCKADYIELLSQYA